MAQSTQIDTDTVHRRCLVSGRVQGVFYRASAAARARELCVNGYARNLPDGRVEVLACGSAAAVAAFIEWLQQGPPAARVTDVQVECVSAPRPLPATFTTA
jgi:acylphosphatase